MFRFAHPNYFLLLIPVLLTVLLYVWAQIKRRKNLKLWGELETLKQKLSEQKTLAQNIIADIQSKTANDRAEIKVSIEQHSTIETAIDNSIKLLKEDEQSKELEKLQNSQLKLQVQADLKNTLINLVNSF